MGYQELKWRRALRAQLNGQHTAPDGRDLSNLLPEKDGDEDT